MVRGEAERKEELTKGQFVTFCVARGINRGRASESRCSCVGRLFIHGRFCLFSWFYYLINYFIISFYVKSFVSCELSSREVLASQVDDRSSNLSHAVLCPQPTISFQIDCNAIRNCH